MKKSSFKVRDKKIRELRIKIQDHKHAVAYANDQIADLQVDLKTLQRKLEEEEYDLQKLVGVRTGRASKHSVSH